MKNTNEQQGFISIIAVLGVGIFSIALALNMMGGVLQQLIQSRNNVSTNQAFYAAEASALEGTYQAFKSADYSGGTAPVLNNSTSAIILLDGDFGRTDISGESIMGDTKRIVSYALLRYPEGDAFRYGLYTPHIVDISGNATVNGHVFAADGVNPTGDPMGSAEINGDVIDDQIPHPPIINDAEYYLQAVANGTYFDNVSDAETYIDENLQDGDIIFIDNIDGDRMIIGSTEFYFKGSLWVTGDLKITGGTFDSVEPYVLIIAEGDLELVGNPTINGIVYVKGDTTIGAGTVNIFGSLICVGDTSIIDVSGNITITYDPHIVNFWEDIVGLEHSYEPVILGWNEE